MSDSTTHRRPPTGRVRAGRAALAGGAALVLLLGVGGTFARWFDTEPVGGGDLAAGELSFDVAAGAGWFDISPDVTETAIDTATFALVPGDVLQYRASIVPTIVGDNLQATLDADIATPGGSLAEFVTVSASIDGEDSVPLTEADSGVPVPVTVTVTLPFSTGGEPGSGNGTDGQNTELDLESLLVQLIQDDRV